MKNNFKRCLALLLALMTIVGAFSIPVSAAEICNHDNREVVITKEADCDESGYTTYRCKDCGEFWTEDIVLPYGHKWATMAEGKPASCAAPGYKPGAEVCTVCGEVKDPSDAIGKTQGHVWDLTKPEKTNGFLCDPVQVKDKDNKWVQNYVTITKYCTVCKKDIVIHKTPTIGHAPEVYEYEVTYPTCAQAGVSIKKCKYCGDASAINVAKYEHDVTGWTKVKSFNGKVWSDDEGRLVDSNIALNDSTCVEVKKCNTCGYVLEARATTAHNAGTVKSRADACGYPGYNTVECTGCKYVYKVEVAVQHVHSGVAKYSQPAIHTATKLQAGYSEYDCTKCTRVFKVYTDPTQEFIEEAHTIGAAHTMLEVKMNTVGYYVKPTCTENGYGRYECTDPNCAFSVLDVIPELNHIDPATGLSAWVPVRPERCDKVWYITNQCSLCQAEELVGEAQEPVDHSAKHIKTTIAATCFWEGREVVTCPDCLDADGNPVVISSTITAPKENHDPFTYHVPTDNGLTGCFNTRIEYLKCTACSTSTEEVKVETGRFYYDTHAFGAEKMGIVPTCHSEGEMIKECSRCHATVVTAKLPVDSSNHTGANPGTAGKEKYMTSKGSIDVVVGDLTYIHDLKENVDPSLKGADGKHKYDCSTRYYTWWYCGGCHQELMLPSVYDDPDTPDVEKYVSGEGVHCFEIDTTNGKAATCVSTGIGDMTCKACGFVVEDAVIPATGHAKGTKIPAQCVAPTCTSVGVDYFQCANGCGGVYVETVEINENAHSYPTKSGKNVYTILVDSTCVTWGRQCQTCSRCGFQTNFSTIALKAHGVVKGWTHVAAKAATCTAAGNVEYFKCKECNATYTGYSGHYDANKNGKVDKNEDKRTTGTASTSTTQTLVENVVLTKLGHSPAAAVDHTSTDCTTYGYKSISCSRCQLELEWTDFDEPGAHTPQKKSDNKTIDVKTVKATCQRGGYTYKLCTVCKDDAGNATKFDITPVANDPIKPHVSKAKNYIVGDCRLILGDTSCDTCKGTGTTGIKTGDEYVKCPDCESWKLYICANDADPDTTGTQACGAFVPAAHEYLLVGNYDACNASVYACKFCKDSYDVVLAGSTINTVNHTFVPSAESVAPTTTSEGIDAKECAICGFVTKDRIAKLTGVIFSLEAYNPNTTAIVNGGKLYVDVMMDAEAISVNNIRVSVNYDSTVLKFVGVVDGTSVFGEYTNPQSDASVDLNTKIGTAIIFDDAGSERVNVDIEGVVKFVTLEFYVEPGAYEPKGREITEVSFTDVAGFENAVTYKDVETGEAFEYGFDVEIFDEVEISIDQLGDINNDGKVNNVDFVALRNAFGGEYDAVLDINHDGEINMDDVNRMKQYMVGKYAYTDFADLDAYFARLEAEKEAANKNNK